MSTSHRLSDSLLATTRCPRWLAALLLLLALVPSAWCADVAISTITFQPGFAPINKPVNVAVDLQGNVYFTDCNTHTIRKMTPTGTVSIFAGTLGVSGSSNVGSGEFFNPTGIAVDASGTVYVADYNNQLIRKVTADGTVSTLAGQALIQGSADGTGSGAQFCNPCAIAVDSGGTLYVTDQGNDSIRVVTQGGAVSTLAGKSGFPGSADGTAGHARFNNPCGIAVDTSGTLYVTDQDNETIRMITANGAVTTIAGQIGVPGSANGPALTMATFNQPTGIAVDAFGVLYITDFGSSIIRTLTPDGTVSTPAGTAGTTGSLDGTGPAASFTGPEGVAVDSQGRLIIADTFNNLIRVGMPAPAVVPSADDAWQPLGTGVGVNDNASTWGGVVIGSQLYLSGEFTSVDGVSANGIAEWTGSGWTGLGSGINGTGDRIAQSAGIIYETGQFTTAGSVSATNVAAWNGSAWTALGSGVPSYPYAATIYNGLLVVGGGFDNGMGGFTPFVQSWDGTSWSTIATGSGGWVYNLIQYGNDLIIGGDYHDLGGAGNDYLVSWDGTSFSLPGGGVNAEASNTMVNNGVLYVSGIFSAAGTGSGEIAAPYVASFDGTSWSALGSSFTGGDETMIPTAGGIYAFGGGTGTPAHAAFWDGSTWTSTGGGTDGDIYHAVSLPGGIVVAGPFSHAGGKSANGVAIFNPNRIAYAGTLVATTATATAGTLSSVDALGDPITITLVSQPLHGTVVLTDAASGTYQYTSTAAYTGPDAFVFTGTTTTGVSNPATVSVTVNSAVAPSVTITTPATSAVVLPASGPLALAGSASDPIGVVGLAYTMSGATAANGSVSVASSWSFTTPTLAIGTTTIVVTATDATGNAGSASLTVQVLPPPTIISANSVSGAIGTLFTYTIVGTNRPTSFSAITLPAGLTLDAASGVISGTPTAAGPTTISLAASNAGGTGSGSLLLTVSGPSPVITSATSASGVVGTPFSYTITATNSPTGYSTSALPTGLTLDATSGIISGTPTAASSSVVTLGATNGNGSGTASLSLSIVTVPLSVIASAAPVQPDPASGPSVAFLVVFSQAVTGFVPAGVLISGTAGGTLQPTITGSGSIYTVTVTGMTSPGTVTLAVLAGAAVDAAGTPNLASPQPVPSITWSSPHASPWLYPDDHGSRCGNGNGVSALLLALLLLVRLRLRPARVR